MSKLIFISLVASFLLAAVECRNFQTSGLLNPDLIGNALVASRVAANQKAISERRAARTVDEKDLKFVTNTTTPLEGLSMQASYGQVCPDNQHECPSGYFCVENVLCLEGTTSDYSPAELLTIGAVSKLVSDEFGVKFNCLEDIGATFTDLFTALSTWVEAGDSAGDKQEAMPYLQNAVKDLSGAFKDCANVAKSSLWSKLVGWIKDVVEAFFPEVKVVVDAYEILVKGEDLFNDFDDMLYVCASNSGQTDYIQCGSDMGDMVYIVYKALSSKK